MLKFKEKWGVGIWAGRDNLADMHIILTRQGALTARSIRRLAPTTAADQQLLLAAKGHPGRLKAMTDEPEVLPLPPAQCSTPIRLPETAAAQEIAAEPAPATPAGGAEESKHCEEEPEEKLKTDTQMDDVERRTRSTSTSEAGETSDSTSPCSIFRGLYAQLRRMHREDLPSHQSMPTPHGAGGEKVLETTGARRNRLSSPSPRAAPRFQAGQMAAWRLQAKTTHQTPGTVDVAPMAGVQTETQGETEGR